MHLNEPTSRKRLFGKRMLGTRVSQTVRTITLLLLTLFVFPACAGSPSPLDPASPATRSIANLHSIVLWVATIVFIIVCVLLVYSIVRFRRKSDDDPEPDQSFHGNAVLEAIWTIIPVVILLGILVVTFQTFDDINPDRPTDMTIKVTGKQWLWAVEYPEQNIKLTNEIRIPLGADVKIEIEAQDVLHSFWVPQLGGKMDAVPGYKTFTWFKADRLGTFHGQCAEYCGLGHATMPMKVTVLAPNSFDTWAAATAANQANAGAQGELVFSSNCSSCHAIDGSSAAGNIGPNLTNIYTEKDEAYILESIKEPNAVIAPVCPTGSCPSGVMPQNFAELLSDQDINNIITYLKEASGVTE